MRLMLVFVALLLMLASFAGSALAQARPGMPPTLDACGVESVAGFGAGVLRGRAEARALSDWRDRVRELYPRVYDDPRNSHRSSRNAYCFPTNASNTHWRCRVFLRPCGGRTVHTSPVQFRTCPRLISPPWRC